MSDAFELVARGQLDDLRMALDADPGLALVRHESGASLLAWAHYTGQVHAAGLIRGKLGELDPHDAIIAGDAERLRDALSAGWDANARSADGFTPLALAAFFGRDDIFDMLLPVTGDVNAAAENAQRVAAIHAAAARRNAAMVEKLLRAGADPDQVQADGFTALHAAAQHGDGATAALLVFWGAAVGKRGDSGLDAAALARAGGHDWLAARLEACARP